MTAPSMVFTIRFAARRLGVDLEVIEELAEQMEPEDGCLRIIDSLDDDAESTTAFTSAGSTISTSSSTSGGWTSWAKPDSRGGLPRMDTAQSTSKQFLKMSNYDPAGDQVVSVKQTRFASRTRRINPMDHRRVIWALTLRIS